MRGVLWLAWPTIFLVGVAAFMLRPEAVVKAVPGPWSISAGGADKASVLPVYPKTMLQAWDMGGLLERLTSGREKDSELLELAREVLGQAVTREQLLNMRSLLVAMESQQSIVQRVRGCFSFVNFIWLLSIFGIISTASPVLLLIARPVHQLLRYLAMELVLPFLRAIKPVYEAAAWMLCYSIIVQASRYTDPDTRIFVCLTGLLGTLPAWGYSSNLHPPVVEHGQEQGVMALSSTYFALSALPLAVRFDSALIGFLAIAAVYSALGFGVANYNLCYYIGFDDKSALERCLLSSLILLTALLWARICRPELLLHFRPLLPGLSTLGSVNYFLALLIKCYTSTYGRAAQYWRMQAWMILSLLTAFALGSVYQIAPIRNTSAVFSVLYVMERACDFMLRKLQCLPLAIFAASVGLWRASLFLHQHPAFIASLFTGHGTYDGNV